jgi:hypothetical protein
MDFELARGHCFHRSEIPVDHGHYTMVALKE